MSQQSAHLSMVRGQHIKELGAQLSSSCPHLPPALTWIKLSATAYSVMRDRRCNVKRGIELCPLLRYHPQSRYTLAQVEQGLYLGIVVSAIIISIHNSVGKTSSKNIIVPSPSRKSIHDSNSKLNKKRQFQFYLGLYKYYYCIHENRTPVFY